MCALGGPGAATAAAHRDTDQGTCHFCSPHCAATFDNDPHRYTSALR